MRSFFRFLYVVTEFKPQIMDAYAAIVIWMLVRWIRTIKSTVFSVRDWLGSVGILAGTFSALLFTWFYIYYTAEKKLLAHGAALDIYYIVSSCSAIAGLILTLIGRSSVRGSAFIVSLVMVLEWYLMWCGGLGLDEVITFATLLLLVLYGTISLGAWYLKYRRRVSGGRQAAQIP